ncbi:MAG: hypothetical protein IPH54_21985 [Rhodoferax sp.]|nr:hypothetical protein [Rhodoferax sp.]
MPAALAEARLSPPASGLYANIANMRKAEVWQSSSSLGSTCRFKTEQETGQWRFEPSTAPAAGQAGAESKRGPSAAKAYGVRKDMVDQQTVPLVLSVPGRQG